MSDDGVGLVVAREIKSLRLPDVVVDEQTSVDLDLLLQFKEASKLVVVDALRAGAAPGTVSVHSVEPRKGILSRLPDLHSVQLYDVIDLAREAGMDVSDVVVVGVEPGVVAPGEDLSPSVRESLPKLVETVRRELRKG